MDLTQGQFDVFFRKHRLTKRERQIVCLVAEGITSSQSLADRLSLSVNTVNNHLNSIYDKADCSGKSELLSILVRFLLKEVKRAKPFVRSPRVLVVDEDDASCESLVHSLRDRGVRAMATTKPERVLSIIRDDPFDTVILPSKGGAMLIREIRAHFRYTPILLLTTERGEAPNADELLAKGAAGIFDKPLDEERIFYSIMEHFIEDIHERNRYLRVNSEISVQLDSLVKLRASNIGCGGAFIPCRLEQLSKFHEDATIGLSFTLPHREHIVRVKARVVWKRESQEGKLPTGVGVKFVDVSPQDAKIIKEFVRLHRIISFIPRGDEEVADALTLS